VFEFACGGEFTHRNGQTSLSAHSRHCKVYFLQKPSLPFVMTTQLLSFSKPFIPVSAPVAALMVSVLPLRVNSIASPLAMPSKDFGPSRLAISIEYLSPFFEMSRYVSSTPGQRPTSASTFAVLVAGPAAGDVAGDASGLAGATGVGDAGVFTSGVHAAIPIAVVARTDNKTDLLNLLMFILCGQSHHSGMD
jgi:hypothetical protein